MLLLNNENTRKTDKWNTLYETSIATVYSFLSAIRHTLLVQIPHIASNWNTLELTPIVIRVPSPHLSCLLRKLNQKFSVGIAKVVGRNSLHWMSYLDRLRPEWWQFETNKMLSINQFQFRLSTLYKNIDMYKKPNTCRVVIFNAVCWLPHVQPSWKNESYICRTASSRLLSKPEIRYYVYLCQPINPVLHGFMHKAMALW